MLSLFRYLSVTLVSAFGNWDSSSARFARRRTLSKNMEICTKFPTAWKNIHILAYFAQQRTLWECITLHPKTQKRMKNVIKREQCKLACGLPSVNILSKVSKFKVLLYLKKSGLNKQGKAHIMGRITLNNSKANIRKEYRKVGKITLKCDYLLNIRTFCVFFQRKWITLYQEQ